MALLKVISGDASGQTYEVDRDELIIGRSPDDPIVVDDPAVSGRHCSVTKSGRRYLVKDLGSTNGTMLNKAPVEQSFLKPGDIIRVGSVEILFEGDDVEVVEGRTPPARTASAPPSQRPSARPLTGTPTIHDTPAFGTRRDSRWAWLLVIIVVIALIGAASAWFLTRLFSA